jgi:hypothetical protein
MSVVHDEQRLRFTFDDDWKVLKWDEHGAYRSGIQQLRSTDAVDFFGLYMGAPWFIEVKDYRRFPGVARKRLAGGELARQVGSKVRDTLAGMIWACGRATLDEGALDEYLRSLVGWGKKIPVVLWIEDDGDIPSPDLSALADNIKREISWLNPRVVVINSERAAASPIPGLIVTSLR